MHKFIKLKIRNILKIMTYYFYYIFFKNLINIRKNGKALKNGITAVISMKNESYTLPFCLESLIDVVDQIVIIDNGSQDNSLEIAKNFQKNNVNNVEVNILEMPNALLGDCRRAGLNMSKYQWHLRWDADMIAQTDGMNSIKILREKVLKINRPTAIQLPRTNLFGDIEHAMGIINEPGEPFLIWFNRHITYKEFGKFDTVKLPLYYNQTKEDKHYIFHCSGLKSDNNLLHRFHYFTWREYYNKFNGNNRPKSVQDFNLFKLMRNKYLFGTINEKSLKYRYIRQLVSQFVKFETNTYGDYPKVLKAELVNNNRRFKVIYKDNKPFIRIDNVDEEMKNYTPTEEDINWDIDLFFTKLFAEKPEFYL